MKDTLNGKSQIPLAFLVSFLSGHLVVSHVHNSTFCDSLLHTHTHWFYNVLHTHIHKYSMTLIPTPFLLHTHFVTPARPHNTNTVTLHSQIHHNQHFTFGQRLFTCPHATACEPTRHHCLGVWLIWDDLSLQISILPVTRHLRCP